MEYTPSLASFDENQNNNAGNSSTLDKKATSNSANLMYIEEVNGEMINEKSDGKFF